VAVAFGGDGRRLASAGGDYPKGAVDWGKARTEVILWDAATGKPLRTIPGPPRRLFNALALSPDGTRLLAAAGILKEERAELALWDTRTGKLLTTLTRDGELVAAVGFSPDGKEMYTLSQRGSARGLGGVGNAVTFWDAAGKQLKVYKAPEGTLIGHVSYGADGVCRAVRVGTPGAGVDAVREVRKPQPQPRVRLEEIRIWELAANRLLDGAGRLPELGGVALHPDGGRLVVQFLDDKTRQMTGKLLERGRAEKTLFTSAAPREAGMEELSRPQFAPNGKRLVVLQENVPLLADLTCTAPARLVGHTGPVTHAAFSADGRRLATASTDGTVKIWDTDAAPEPFTAAQQWWSVNNVAFSPDSKRLAAAVSVHRPFPAADGGSHLEIHVWEMTTRKRLLSVTRPKQTGQAVVFSPDGKRFVSVSAEGMDGKGKQGYPGEVVIWDADKGTPGLTLRGHANSIYSVAFSPDGRLLATAGGNYDRAAKKSGPGEIKLWDAESGREVRAFPGHESTVWKVVFSRDGKRLVSASGDSTVRVWETDTGKEVLVFRGHRHSVYDVAFSPDGQLLASVGGDPNNRGNSGDAFLWDAASGEQRFALPGHMGIVARVAFSPAGKRLATGSGYWDTANNTYTQSEIKFWDVATGQEVLNLRGDQKSSGYALILGLAFSPDGARVAYSSRGTVTVLTAPFPGNDRGK
jgi:WD40 repeat protein